MKQIGIKLADGTFYPVLEEDVPKTRKLDLTTVKDNQTKVQVDLYRSETGTMDDAEYVDTLEVSKLNPRPNGEPNLHLSLNLDENGDLNAEVIDGETGKKSELQVNLVTRTLAERENSEPDFVLEPPIDTSELDSFSFNDARPTETPVASEPQPEIDTTAPFSFDTAPEPAAEEDFPLPDFDSLPQSDTAPAADSGDSLDLPDFGDNNAASADDALAATAANDDFSLPDFDALDAPAPDTAPAADSSSDSLDLPDFGDNNAASADDAPAATTASDDFSLPDFDALEAPAPDTAPAADSSGDSLDLPDFGDNNAASADNAPAATTASDDFSLPDFDALDATAPNAAPAANNAFSIESLDLPDFGDTDTNGGTDVALPDFDLSATNAIGTELNLDDPAFDDPIFTTPTKAEKASSGGLMDFSDLYDKETLAGGSTMASEPDDNSRRKTRVPVIVCVVCAMICTLATLLVLFIIPSRYNLLLSRKLLTEQTTAPVAMAQPENAVAVTESSPAASLQPAPAIAPAREDVIVIAPNASTVVPAPTVSVAPAVTPKRSGDVTYRIKWGDTLWDISDAYYNNPWKYPRIADYNRIPNPDLIIAGTDIKIPKE